MLDIIVGSRQWRYWACDGEQKGNRGGERRVEMEEVQSVKMQVIGVKPVSQHNVKQYRNLWDFGTLGAIVVENVALIAIEGRRDHSSRAARILVEGRWKRYEEIGLGVRKGGMKLIRNWLFAATGAKRQGKKGRRQEQAIRARSVDWECLSKGRAQESLVLLQRKSSSRQVVRASTKSWEQWTSRRHPYSLLFPAENATFHCQPNGSVGRACSTPRLKPKRAIRACSLFGLRRCQILVTQEFSVAGLRLPRWYS